SSPARTRARPSLSPLRPPLLRLLLRSLLQLPPRPPQPHPLSLLLPQPFNPSHRQPPRFPPSAERCKARTPPRPSDRTAMPATCPPAGSSSSPVRSQSTP